MCRVAPAQRPRGGQLLDRDRDAVVIEGPDRLAPLRGGRAPRLLERDPQHGPGRLVVEDQRTPLVDEKGRRRQARQKVASQDQLDRLLRHPSRSLAYARPRMRHGACGALILVTVALAALTAWAEPAGAQVPGLPVLPIVGD